MSYASVLISLLTVDELTTMLDGPRSHDAFVIRAVLAPPWGLRIQDEAPMSLVAVLRGSCAVRYDDGESAVAEAGDVVVLRGPDHYEVADPPDTAAAIVIHPGQRCTTLDGIDLKDAMTLGVRTWGNTADERATVMLTAAYAPDGELSRSLLASLPRRIHLPARLVATPIVDLLANEISREVPGQQAVLDRLLDLLLVSTLRTWFDQAGDTAPRWYLAHRDRLVGGALRLIQSQPAEPWTVERLAAAVGCSRAVFARRFHELVGEPPMQYLTEWRLSLAADALREPGIGLAEVAARVGYGTPFALSAAFKRVRGESPSQYRRSIA